MEVEVRTATPRTFERFAGVCALIIGVGGIGYSIAFLVLLNRQSRAAVYAESLFLLLGGLLTTAVAVALYGRLRQVDPSFALWAALLAVAGSIGSAIHGGYELAIRINPPTRGLGASGLPNPVDPRGLMTFALVAISLFVVAWLMRGEISGFPRRLAYVGFLSAGLMGLLYLGRLIILDADNPALLTVAGLEGFLVNPAWFIWLGLELRRGGPAYVDMTEEG